MSRITINRGVAANDGTGDSLRNILGQINSMTSEIYDLKNKIIDLSSLVVNDEDDLYAHESQLVITRIQSKTLMLVIYINNKTDELEWLTSAHATLKVFELTTHTLLKTFDLFYPGIVAGVTMPADEEINAPRIYVTGTTLKCFCCNTSALYMRDIDISSSDAANWTAGNISISQMTMKDAGGNNVLADVTSANIQIHLENVLGDAYAGYADMMPMFRNMDIAKSGDNWYTTLEFSGERSHELGNITICVTSANAGVAWAFGSLIGYTTSVRNSYYECSLVFVGTVLHFITRPYLYHYTSANGGVTWVASNSLFAIFPAYEQSKPAAINATVNGVATVLIAIQLSSEITGNTTRTTLGIYSTTDMITFTEVEKIVINTDVHYPALCYYGRSLYCSYTKGLKFNSVTGNDPIDRNVIVVARIY